MMTTTEYLAELHGLGVHFVRARAKDEGEKRAKSALDSGWQRTPASLESIVAHVQSGGLAGYIPGRSGLWAADVDHFPDDSRSARALLQKLNIEPLATVSTKRGLHLLFRRVAIEPKIPNQNWEQSGFRGELRGDAGYLILWEPQKLLDALAIRELAAPVSAALFPKVSQRQQPANGWAVGSRSDTLNRLVFTAALRGETDFSVPCELALAADLPPDKIATIVKKAIADADAKKAAAFPRKDATALEGALAQLGITIRYNIRAMQPELSNGGATWEKTTDRSSADLRRVIATKFSYQLPDDKGTAPLRYGLDSWAEHLNAIASPPGGRSLRGLDREATEVGWQRLGSLDSCPSAWAQKRDRLPPGRASTWRLARYSGPTNLAGCCGRYPS